MFNINIFDEPDEDSIEEADLVDLPPPPPTFSEEELEAAKAVAFEEGRKEGQTEQMESREQFVAARLEAIAQHFSHLFAAETIRENIFEKESLRLTLAALDLLFPLMNERLGHAEVTEIIKKTLQDHRKTKEITIRVPPGLRGEIDALITRIRKDEQDEALWRVIEDETLKPGDCLLEWSDGGAVRDSVKTARAIREKIEALLGAAQEPVSEMADSGISLEDKAESDETDGGKE